MSSIGTQWKYRASASTSAIFISSDGCTWIGPTSIQRLAPMPTSPITSTRSNSPSAPR